MLPLDHMFLSIFRTNTENTKKEIQRYAIHFNDNRGLLYTLWLADNQVVLAQNI